MTRLYTNSTYMQCYKQSVTPCTRLCLASHIVSRRKCCIQYHILETKSPATHRPIYPHCACQWRCGLPPIPFCPCRCHCRPARRFNKIAVRNWERMKTSANQAYSITVKPLVDRLSGDQQGQ